MDNEEEFNLDSYGIQDFNVDELPTSSFNLVLGKRRSGKTVIVEYLIKQMIERKMLDIVLLFSPTDSGFDMIDRGSRFKTIEPLHQLLSNMKLINEYNKGQKKKDTIKIKVCCIIDDFAVELKSKKMNILETLAVNGRHSAYDPLSLHFMILCQSLTKVPRVVRLNTDNIFLNSIASCTELNMVLDENMYLIDGSLRGKRNGRQLYNHLVMSEDYQFIVVENHRQNIKEYKDYIKKYKAIL
jgi:hypothetical protein